MPKVLIKFYAKLNFVKIIFFLASVLVGYELIILLIENRDALPPLIADVSRRGTDALSSTSHYESDGYYRFLVDGIRIGRGLKDLVSPDLIHLHPSWTLIDFNSQDLLEGAASLADADDNKFNLPVFLCVLMSALVFYILIEK